MKLFVDQGNSYFKWAARDDCWRTGRIVRGEIPAFEKALEEAFSGVPDPEHILLASVASQADTDHLVGWLTTRFHRQPVQFRSTAACSGVINRYELPETLGSDRWAALIAIRNRYQSPACIVDCGTAITIDVLDAEGVFHGGVILPGLGLARDSLVRGTANLEFAHGDDLSVLARSTSTGIAAGTLMGILGGIRHVFECQQQETGLALSLYLTGGDAALLAPHLEMPFEVIDDLVLQGLEVASEQLE